MWRRSDSGNFRYWLVPPYFLKCNCFTWPIHRCGTTISVFSASPGSFYYEVRTKDQHRQHDDRA